MPAVKEAPNGLEQRGMTKATLCVHFAARGDAHAMAFAEPAPAAELHRARAARLVIEWDESPGPLLRGRALLRGEVACEAYLFPPAPFARTASEDRVRLRAAGLSRARSALLSRMPDRPLLATVTRGPDPSPQLLRRIHSLLLAGRVREVAAM